MQPFLQQLMDRGALWQGRQSHVQELAWVSAADPLLDQALGGGWVRSRIHELQVQQRFSGEMPLLAPAINNAVARGLSVFWVAPPAIPNAPALASTGAESRHIVLTPNDESDALWAAETILYSGQAGVLLLWAKKLSATATRRLHLAASDSDAYVFVITDWQPEEARSYGTRLRIHHEQGQVQWQILKRHGGWPVRLPRRALPRWPHG
ncbi:hypothetical protein FM042_06610 [Aliidiomarina halalkaliphila]|uniref:SOS cell division inhibitor SulA n=1 Tax=Aliidiomarina halalkaliphila TaxID=2593535 RepID=A0A552X0W0_9GAMM|nr:hypothetical protein [Aliidiomarina halalkaliphila]TRW48654.1 hypothetical protein FM042_06610 [Aliidiomarina halalkaliphila]